MSQGHHSNSQDSAQTQPIWTKLTPINLKWFLLLDWRLFESDLTLLWYRNYGWKLEFRWPKKVSSTFFGNSYQSHQSILVKRSRLVLVWFKSVEFELNRGYLNDDLETLKLNRSVIFSYKLYQGKSPYSHRAWSCGHNGQGFRSLAPTVFEKVCNEKRSLRRGSRKIMPLWYSAAQWKCEKLAPDNLTLMENR